MTGIRFAVKNNVIRIEIQKGQIKNGAIDPKTQEWKSADDYPLKIIHDIVTLDYNIKSFNLDDIKLPFGEFVTGNFIVKKNNFFFKLKYFEMINFLMKLIIFRNFLTYILYRKNIF